MNMEKFLDKLAIVFMNTFVIGVLGIVVFGMYRLFMDNHWFILFPIAIAMVVWSTIRLDQIEKRKKDEQGQASQDA